MQTTYKRAAVYVMMAINMIVGFSLLFFANELGLLSWFW